MLVFRCGIKIVVVVSVVVLVQDVLDDNNGILVFVGVNVVAI